MNELEQVEGCPSIFAICYIVQAVKYDQCKT